MLENESYRKLKTLIDSLPVDERTKYDITTAALDWAEAILKDVRTMFDGSILNVFRHHDPI